LNDLKTIKGNVEHLDRVIAPIYQSTLNNLCLNFQEDSHHYIVQKNKKIAYLELINSFYDFYQTQNLEEIKKVVIEKKPFIAKILDSYR
jgi:hypothetical protein